ncbi:MULTISPECIES: hypothetical protein [Rhizobium]|uniref:Uncharacterized protein n=1 Tax=Rhizobium favelukesii TaxID=348824 RepID=W6RVR9_9HYPH|nr:MULTISPECIES: hypothetical protein [Rhizobium]MCA0805453.1 hypothetical protein [Rhizobium sp. T1473]MCS0461727.1 hypothetical protein [Rhizobium favelukesii]UFS79216.1 hypothetical protein LPB79_06340 [Rhizobium sp. T136]CDM62743.1 hypothetical protein LPU83_pLPU83d_1373 [Rhizobium favelukesii]
MNEDYPSSTTSCDASDRHALQDDRMFDDNILTGRGRTDGQTSGPTAFTDFSFIKNALKTLSREISMVRDRKAELEIAALLIALVKQGVHDEEQLIILARERWLEAAQRASGETAR